MIWSNQKTSIALALAFAVIFRGFFLTTNAQTYNQYQNFNDTRCKRVQVTWLANDDYTGKYVKIAHFDPDLKKFTEIPNLLEKVGKEYKNIVTKLTRYEFIVDNEPTYKKYCVEFQEEVPIGPKGELSKSVGGDSGIDLASNYVSMVYKFGSMFIGLICVLIIVISGVQITAGGADPEGVSKSKERIIQALISLVLLFSISLIVRTVNPGFFT